MPKNTYGYRKVWISPRYKGIVINHKIVLGIMRVNRLLCTKFHIRTRRHSSYRWKIGKLADNKLNRKFKLEKSNEVWVSDVTQFKVPVQKKAILIIINGFIKL